MSSNACEESSYVAVLNADGRRLIHYCNEGNGDAIVQLLEDYYDMCKTTDSMWVLKLLLQYVDHVDPQVSHFLLSLHF